MLKKQGLPQENELVICTVTKIQHHSVFCRLDEYDKSGMLHISEISSGRIRNIGEYVKEGKTIICKVLRIDEQKGHIDLSLRRVTEAQRKAKATQIKKHQAALKIVEAAAEQLGVEASVLWEELDAAKDSSHESLYDQFQAIVEENKPFPLKGKTGDVITGIVTDRLKPTSVTIKGILDLTTYAPDGVALINDAFTGVTGIEAAYLGGGHYALSVSAKDYKKAETLLKAALDALEAKLRKGATVFAFERTDR